MNAETIAVLQNGRAALARIRGEISAVIADADAQLAPAGVVANPQDVYTNHPIQNADGTWLTYGLNPENGLTQHFTVPNETQARAVFQVWIDASKGGMGSTAGPG